MVQLVVLGVAIVLAILLALVFFVDLTPEPYPNDRYTHDAQTLPLADLQSGAMGQVGYVRDKTTVFSPMNASQMDVVETAIAKATKLEQLGVLALLMPSASIGSYPLTPLPNTPGDLVARMNPQFDLSNTGWYWAVGTAQPSTADPDTPVSSSFSFSVVRTETENRNSRNDLGKLDKDARSDEMATRGARTLWNVSVGFVTPDLGQGFVRSPFTVAQCKYTSAGPGVFSLESIDTNGTDRTSFKLTSKLPNDTVHPIVTFDCTFTDPDLQVQRTLNVMLGSPVEVRGAFPNAEGSCAPCISGTGSTYFSLIDMVASWTASIVSTAATSQKYVGWGWLDRQMPRASGLDTYGAALAMNEVRARRDTSGAASKYVWMTATLPAYKRSYMISATRLSPDDLMAVDDTLPAQYNMYIATQSGVYEFGMRATITVLAVVTVRGVTYPSNYSVSLAGAGDTEDTALVLHLDTARYPGSVGTNQFGGDRWAGGVQVSVVSGIATTGEQGPGVGFVEASGFAERVDQMRTTLQLSGIDASEANIDLFLKGNLLTPGWAAANGAVIAALFILVFYIIGQSLAIAVLAVLGKLRHSSSSGSKPTTGFF